MGDCGGRKPSLCFSPSVRQVNRRDALRITGRDFYLAIVSSVHSVLLVGWQEEHPAHKNLSDEMLARRVCVRHAGSLMCDHFSNTVVTSKIAFSYVMNIDEGARKNP